MLEREKRRQIHWGTTTENTEKKIGNNRDLTGIFQAVAPSDVHRELLFA